MLRRILRRFQPKAVLDPELGRLVFRDVFWEGSIAFPNAENSAEILIQVDPDFPDISDWHRRLILEVRDRAAVIQNIIASILAPAHSGTWDIVTIDIQGTTNDDPQLELTVERAEDREVRSVSVRGPLDAPQLTVIEGDAPQA